MAPSVILKKLAAFPQQNRLDFALSELGWLERTLFMLDWLESPELRRRCHAGLNKGETRHALAQAVFLLSREAGLTPEWKDLLRDLDWLQHLRLEHRGANWLVRTDAAPNVAALFRHAHIALPPRARQTTPSKVPSSSISIRKRRSRPKRSATSSRISPQLN